MLVAQVDHQTGFHGSLVRIVIFNIHERLHLLHLVLVLTGLLLANVVVRVVVSLFALLHISVLKRVVDVVDHDLVLDFDVVLKAD